MFSLFEWDAPFLASTLVLLIMGFLSLMLSLYSHSKSRAIRKLPKDLSVKVFNKTFNVFDPYPAKRKMVSGSIFSLLLTISLVAAFVFSFIVLIEIIETGLLLGFIVFIVCISSVTLEESFEIHKNASILVGAIENGVNLGQGDLTILSMVKETLPKLRMYYLSLAVTFFAFSVLFPYIGPTVIWMFFTFLSTLIELTTSGGILAPLYGVFLFSVVIYVIQITFAKVKRKIFSFPQPESLVSLNKPFEAMKNWVVWQHAELIYRPPPEPDEMPDSEREKS